MIPPKIPENENERQAAVEKYQLLDTLPEELYDNITHLIAYICNTPISLITLMDHERNFLKSHYGVDLSESPRKLSFCGHLLYSGEDIMIVEDARTDERFHDNPLVTEFSAIFYAGVPLIDPGGYRLGTLCVYDNKPRELTAVQKDALIRMSNQVIALMVSNYERNQLQLLQHTISDKYESLSKFAHTVSHDLKSPLNQFVSLIDMVELEEQIKLEETTISYLNHLRKSAVTLKAYIDGMLAYYEQDKLLLGNKVEIDPDEFLNDIIKLIQPAHECKITFNSAVQSIRVNRPVLMHILINLITNSFKYNHKELCKTHVEVSENHRHYIFTVQDNGDGIPEEMQNKIFDIFSIGTIKDRYGRTGTGIGLASVKKFVEANGGEVMVSSVEGKGSTFKFTLLK